MHPLLLVCMPIVETSKLHPPVPEVSVVHVVAACEFENLVVRSSLIVVVAVERAVGSLIPFLPEG